MLDRIDNAASAEGVRNAPVEAGSDDWAIRVRNIGKAYRTYPKPLDLLAEAITGKPRHTEHWVLQDISFEVPRGSIVGIIGPNGAGKSTLLKIVAGLLDANTGEAKVRGRVSAILELGTGFHPDFTGRQNIITGGMCLGMTRAEVEERQKWIIDFSELGSVIDRPFKTYSTGMQARLTFATAVSIDPEIFIVDEALAAGDAYFVSKCIKRIHEICSSGATVLFVSHGTNQVAQMCKTAIWLKDGRIHRIGPAREVAKQYDYEVHVRISNNAGQIVEIEPEPLAVEAVEFAQMPPQQLPASANSSIPSSEKPDTAAPQSQLCSPPAAQTASPGDNPAPAAPSGSNSTLATSTQVPAPSPGDAEALDSAPPALSPDQNAPRSAMKVYRKGPVFIEKVVFSDGVGEARSVFRTWDTMRIDVHYSCQGDIPEETLGLAMAFERESDLVLISQFGTVLPAGNETIDYYQAPFRTRAARTGIISAVFNSLQMMNGEFLVSIGVLPNVPGTVDFYEYRHRSYKLSVIAAGYPSGAAYYPLVEWQHKPH
jgi:ABC-type polysaccharide/polyol phosphate transport system ATPase subunit